MGNRINNVLDAEKLQKEQRDEQKKKVEEYKQLLSRTFSTPDGRHTLKNIAISSGFFNPLVNLEHQNALFYELGKKKMFLDIFSFLSNDIKKQLIDDVYK